MTQSNNNNTEVANENPNETVEIVPEDALLVPQGDYLRVVGISEASLSEETPTEATSLEVTDAAAIDIVPEGPIEIADAKRVLEAALLAANEAMQINELRRLFDGQINGDTIRIMLDELKLEWHGRSVELNLVAGGYRFRVKPQYQRYLDKLSNDKPPKYSRAVMETLAIIAYRQPVTRADIEDVRGVQVSPHILKVLEDRGWVEEIGHKEVVGRPALFATTKHFLDDLNLRTLEELPPLHELQSTLENPHNATTQAASLLGALELTPMAPTQHYVDEIPAGTPYAQDESETDFDPIEASTPLPEPTTATDPTSDPMSTPQNTPPTNHADLSDALDSPPLATPAIEEDKKSW